jgi:hypothetical protein
VSCAIEAYSCLGDAFLWEEWSEVYKHTYLLSAEHQFSFLLAVRSINGMQPTFLF